MSYWIKAEDKHNEATIKINTADLNTVDFWKLVLKLYEEVTYCNPVKIKIKGGMNGPVVLKSNGCMD